MNTKAGFVVYGTHKDGLLDPMGTPFIDEAVIARAKAALRARGVELVEASPVVATKQEARDVLSALKKDDAVDSVILFSGTWIWAAHMVAAVRDFAASGKPVIVWTHPGSQGWRPVGGLVLHGALLEIGLPHLFVYADAEDAQQVGRIVHTCRAARVKTMLSGATLGAFGGRGMGQTCGVADAAQWMKVFGVDIDSRDTTELIRAAEAVTDREIQEILPKIQSLFGEVPELNQVNRRSISLYLALRKVVAKNNFDFYTIQSFPGLADDYCATCFAQSMMLDDGVPTSTLSDFNTAMTVYLLMKFSGQPAYYGDLQHIDKAAKEIKIIGDGAVPPSLAAPEDPAGFAAHGIPTEGSAGGMSVKLTCKPGPGVLARLGRRDGKFVMLLAKCQVFVPENLEERKLECGIPFWPHAFVRVEGDIEKLTENYMNEYGVLGYGDELLGELTAFCELTGIECITA